MVGSEANGTTPTAGIAFGVSARMNETKYREVLKRDPDPAGLANYTAQMLEHGWDENRVREALRQSEEYRKMPRH